MLTEDQKTAAVLMALFARIAFNGKEDEGTGWYEWVTTKHFHTSNDLFARSVWWALRFEHDPPGNLSSASRTGEEWLQYLEYVYEGQLSRSK